MKRFDHVLFDLDGTLVDSRKGIMSSLLYSADKMGFNLSGNIEINDLLGPPLNEIFRIGYNASKDQIEKAVKVYREHYGEIGIFESTLFPGVRELLRTLKDSGSLLYIATSKGTPYAEKMLEIHGIRHSFKLVVGSNEDFSISSKSSIINFILEKENISDKSNVVMIGDRSHDIIGANHHNIAGIGVLWGYGLLKELSDCNPFSIIEDVDELVNLLLN